MSRSWLVGTPSEVAEQLRTLAAHHEIEELMLSPATGAFAAELDDGPGARAATIELLAGELLAGELLAGELLADAAGDRPG